ncbi:unnamed protein product, partial [Rotaria magnacalcarata]
MSISKNPLTNYFKKKNIVDNVEEVHEVEIQSNSIEETEALHIKRLKPNELTDSTINTTDDTNTASTISLTAASSILSSSNERDPCHGSTKAKDHILLGPFQPKTNFPTVNGRRFRSEWYTTYQWLEYSLALNRAFCFPCRLRNNCKYDGAFANTGFSHWKNGRARFNDHQAANYHKEAFEIWKTGLQNYNNNTDVLKLINQQHSKQANENRMYLKEIIRTIHLLTRQGISFISSYGSSWSPRKCGLKEQRHVIFEEIQEEAGLKALTIKQLSDTRWTCRWNCLKVVLTRYPQIISTLQVMEAPESHLLIHSMERFDFVFHLFIMSEIYLITNILSKYLQSSHICISQALNQVKMTVNALESLRNETEFERFYSTALQISEENEIDPPKELRKKKVPVRFGGGDKTLNALNIEDHYRINTYYAVLDTIITSIKTRFDENIIIDVLLMEKLFLTKTLLNENELKQLSKQYSLNYDDLRGEQRLYKAKLSTSTYQSQATLSEIRLFILENHLNACLPVMDELFKILWTIPVNTCTCERSFSTLRRIKTYLRSTTGEYRLSGLALLNIEREVEIDYGEI